MRATSGRLKECWYAAGTAAEINYHVQPPDVAFLELCVERGVKLVTPLECSPCYRRECDITPSCQDNIPVDTVAEAVAGQLELVETETADGVGGSA